MSMVITIGRHHVILCSPPVEKMFTFEVQNREELVQHRQTNACHHTWSCGSKGRKILLVPHIPRWARTSDFQHFWELSLTVNDRDGTQPGSFHRTAKIQKRKEDREVPFEGHFGYKVY